jgi:hypothetical protein
VARYSRSLGMDDVGTHISAESFGLNSDKTSAMIRREYGSWIIPHALTLTTYVYSTHIDMYGVCNMISN